MAGRSTRLSMHAGTTNISTIPGGKIGRGLGFGYETLNLHFALAVFLSCLNDVHCLKVSSCRTDPIPQTTPERIYLELQTRERHPFCRICLPQAVS
jgi:hypothetical protein